MSPIYDFRCLTCFTKEENVKARMDETEKECPQCGELSVRLLSLPSPPMGGDTPKSHGGGRKE